MQNKYTAWLAIFIVCVLMSAPVGRANAQVPLPNAKTLPRQRASYQPLFLEEKLAEAQESAAVDDVNLVGDPSLELSHNSTSSYWVQSSTNFETPLCTVADCTNRGGTSGPYTGSVWAWFGGVNFSRPGSVSPEIGVIYENIVFPTCSATLQFYFWISAAAPGSDANDYFAAKIDGITVFSANATQKNAYPTYKLITVNVNSFANGQAHTVEFYSKVSGQLVSFNLDDVALFFKGCFIWGNAGVAGATLSYTDGTPQTTNSLADGSYSLRASQGWTGTVTPSHPCFTFTPADRAYTNLTVNTTGQNFTPTFPGESGCADVDVSVGGADQGRFGLPAGASTRASFAGVNNGPVQIMSTNAVPLIAAERLIYKSNNVNTSFTEMMGLPDSELDTIYWLPWYNNVDLDTQLRFANVTGSPASVTITIAGQAMGSPIQLAAGASTRLSFAGINAGPVRIESTQNIVAAERLIYKVNGKNTSFSEMMALPNKALDTTYWLPWYNNADLDTQLRFANVTDQPASVHVFIGGAEMTGSPFSLLPGESTRKSFPAVNNGPVRIVSDHGVPIVAAERLIYKVNGVNTSFTEMMALPNSQLDTTYWLPWYNNIDLDTQLRFANLHETQTAQVHVYIGGAEVSNSPFTLLPGQSTRQSFAHLNYGPVQIVSNVPIVAAERLIYKVNGVNTSFSELMALPASQLDTTYWLPWYNNADLDTQLRFGVP
jgi:hypothetical protein